MSRTNPAAQPEPLLLEAQPIITGVDMAKDTLQAPANPMLVATVQPAPVAQVRHAPAATPMALLQIAMDQGADLDRLERLMQMNERWEAGEARKAFVAAMAAFKAEDIKVVKDLENKQFSSPGKKAMYTSLGNLVSTVTPFLSKHGLSVRWDLDQTAGILVTCTMTHSQGHSESTSFQAPPDKSGAKSPIQEIKSAITYAKGVTFESICGLAATDANLDLDGNMPSDMPEGMFQGHLKNIREAKTMDELQTCANTAYRAAKGDKVTQEAIIKAKDKRKAELRGGAQ